MDFYETQKKYRNKNIRLFGGFLLKFSLIIISMIIGWRIGASDKDILVLENEKIAKLHENVKLDLEEKLISTKLKLKEANRALFEKNIIEGKNYGFEAKKILAVALAKGVSEKNIIEHLRMLTNDEKCRNYVSKELSVSTENFIPPNSFLTILGGGLRLKAEGRSKDKTLDKHFFDISKPINLSLIYFGGTENIIQKLPIRKKIYAGKFLINLKVLKSPVRGSVIIKYNTCRL